MEWYYAQNGQQNGPISQENLAELYRNGQISSSDLVWNDSMPDWIAIGTVPEFQGVQSASSSAPASGGDEAPQQPASASSVEEAPQQSTSPSLAPAVAAGSSVTPSTEKVPTYLWQSIVCLILCCLPAAIPAIVYATKVDPALQIGDVAAAREASKNAKMWCWIAFGLGLVANIIIFGFSFIGALAGGIEAA